MRNFYYSYKINLLIHSFLGGMMQYLSMLWTDILEIPSRAKDSSLIRALSQAVLVRYGIETEAAS